MPLPPRLAAAAAALGLAIGVPASGQEVDPEARRGLAVAANMGGGASLFGVSEYAPIGVLEAELWLGYELPLLGGTLRPELAGVLAVSPYLYAGLRVGGSYQLEAMPVYVRGAVDVSGFRGTLQARWLLAGIGYELRLTDAVAAYAEADTGVPLGRAIGLPFLARAGAVFRF